MSEATKSDLTRRIEESRARLVAENSRFLENDRRLRQELSDLRRKKAVINARIEKMLGMAGA